MNDAGKVDLVGVSLIRREDKVLLVRLREAANQGPPWGLPAGGVKPGNLLLDTLARRVREETGLVVQDVGSLLYTMYLDRPTSNSSWHRRSTWRRESERSVPTIRTGLWRKPVSSRFQRRLPGSKACRGREASPIVAHLRGEAGSGAMWLYRMHADGTFELVAQHDGGGAGPAHVAPRNT